MTNDLERDRDLTLRVCILGSQLYELFANLILSVCQSTTGKLRKRPRVTASFQNLDNKQAPDGEYSEGKVGR
jgi:hypothetical protein